MVRLFIYYLSDLIEAFLLWILNSQGNYFKNQDLVLVLRTIISSAMDYNSTRSLDLTVDIFDIRIKDSLAL
jgi:hypothetical protein